MVDAGGTQLYESGVPSSASSASTSSGKASGATGRLVGVAEAACSFSSLVCGMLSTEFAVAISIETDCAEVDGAEAELATGCSSGTLSATAGDSSSTG